jgi:hypothetical protein
VADLIGLEIRNLEPVRNMLAAAMSPANVLAVQKDVAEYFQGKLQHYPEYKYVSRQEAYGKTFFSERQRRWFWAALHSGELQIPYRRTRTLRNAWEIMSLGSDVLLVNETDYAPHVQQRLTQSRMMLLRNWQPVEGVAAQFGGEAVRMATERLMRRIRRR